MRRHIARWALGALVLAATAGSARAEVVQVKIEKLAFTPQQVSAHVGDTIEWANGDFVAHTATARDGSWNVMIPANGSGSLVLKTAGTFDYYCTVHPNMTGQVTVAK
jgi:plastocyanin